MENRINTEGAVETGATELQQNPAATASGETLQRNKYADHMNTRRQKKRKKIGLIVGLVLLALAIAGGVYLVIRSRSASDQPDPNSIAMASRGMLETYVEGNGVTAANKREELGKDIKGKVSELLVSVGDSVKKGDKLLVIDPTETRKELSAAQQELQEAQRGVTTAQSEVTTAQAALSKIQKKGNELTITAPFSGKVVPAQVEDTPVTYKVGQQLSEGTVIGYMVDDSVMKLSLYFSYAYLDQIRAGQTATVSIPSAMSQVTGTVASVEPVQKISDEGVATFRVIVSIQNPGTLTKGMTATATIASNGEELFPASGGTLEYNREEELNAQVSGEIASINGLDYYQYSSGSAILSMKSDTVQEEIKAAQSTLTSAQTGVTSAQKLVQEKQTRIDELQELIAKSVITSPLDGVVTQLNVMVDQTVDGSVTPCVVADLSSIVVKADIVSSDVSAVAMGQSATITMYMADGEQMLTGTVQSVSMEANKENSGSGSMTTFPAVIALDPVEGIVIRPDSDVQYKITTAQVDDCVMVPSSAVVNTETGTAVFARPTDGVAFAETLPIPEGTEGIPKDFVLVPIEVGLSDATNTEIVSGIEEGTEVFLSGPTDLYQDMNDGGDIAYAVG